MSTTSAIVPGVVTPDGNLELECKLSLPAGPGQVTVVSLPEFPKDDPFWQRMQSIWAGQKARGHVPRSVGEVEAAEQKSHAEWDERTRRLERIQAEAKAMRTARSPSP